VLFAFHHAQELFSSERTPTLALVLPAYELLYQILRSYLRTNKFPYLNYTIQAAMTKLDKYVETARQIASCGISMLLNPKSKSSWMSQHWSEVEVELCMQKLKNAMVAYLKADCDNEAQRVASTNRSNVPLASPLSAHGQATTNLGAGFKGLKDLLASFNSPTDAETVGAPSPNTSPTSPESQEVADRHRVESEILRYMADPLFPSMATGFDLVEWWNVHRHSYPLLWKVAHDVLPAQASSVLCEQVFSSSKQTTTQQRNSIAPGLVEKLQILKFGLKEDHLDFTVGFID
jgi:hypothetical protein